MAEKILKARSALEGERKPVTVLFCDIADSTALAEQLGPEGMHTVLNAFFDAVVAEVHRYEGTVKQFLGDGFTALFGVPPHTRNAHAVGSACHVAHAWSSTVRAMVEAPHHPFLDEYARVVDYDTHFKTRDDVMRAIAGYYGLVSAMDENVGRVLQTLEQTGLDAETRVLYTSDHGDNLGARGLWGKSTFFEESAGVPLILAGDGIPAGAERPAAVSHVDVYPFVFECVGAPVPGDDGHPGVSLAALAGGATPERGVVSEYHATRSAAGAFMLREDRYRYVHYVAYPPQLFDLQCDPEEFVDVAANPTYADAIDRCRRSLLTMLDPLEVAYAPSAGRPSCSRVTAAVKLRWRAATWVSRRRRALGRKSTAHQDGATRPFC